jgi:hypothetical protein
MAIRLKKQMIVGAMVTVKVAIVVMTMDALTVVLHHLLICPLLG